MKIWKYMVQITQINGGSLKWSDNELGCHLVKKFDTAPKQNLTESSF